MDGRLDVWIDGWMDGWMDGLMDGWMDGWTNGRTDRRTDRQTDQSIAKTKFGCFGFWGFALNLVLLSYSLGFLTVKNVL